MGLKDKYAIAGIGYTPQGRVPGRIALSFHLEACANAIADAGLQREDIDGLICYRAFPPASADVELEEGLRLLTNIVGCRPGEVKCEMLVEVTWEDITEEFRLPKFKPHQ